MAKNAIQFQVGMSLPKFLDSYGSETQCRAAVMAWRWPNGFQCPNCGYGNACLVRDGTIHQCHRCHSQTSLTAGTLFAHTKLPLRTWLLAIYLLTQSKAGISSLSLKRQLGVSYNTAWLVKHKLMQAMKERDDARPLQGIVQLDDAYWGGERRGQGRGRGAPGKTPFVAAVQCDPSGHPIAMRMSVVKGFRSDEMMRWAKAHLAPGSHIVSDGLHCFRAMKQAGCTHSGEATGSARQHPTTPG